MGSSPPNTEKRPWDAATLLESDVDVAAYLDAVLDEDDPVLLAAALGDVARAKGMTRIAQATGLGRESLYKALSLDGNPQFATVHKVGPGGGVAAAGFGGIGRVSAWAGYARRGFRCARREGHLLVELVAAVRVGRGRRGQGA